MDVIAGETLTGFRNARRGADYSTHLLLLNQERSVCGVAANANQERIDIQEANITCGHCRPYWKRLCALIEVAEEL